MTCKRCTDRVKDWSGDDPKCHWPGGKPDSAFDPSGWNCATANRLRELIGEDEYGDFPRSGEQHLCLRRDDQHYAAFYYGEYGLAGFVVMTWYKHRGRTEYIGSLGPDGAEPLRLEDAEAAIAYLESRAPPLEGDKSA